MYEIWLVLLRWTLYRACSNWLRVKLHTYLMSALWPARLAIPVWHVRCYGWTHKAQASGYPEHIAFHHFRNRDDHEVDIVLERGNTITGIEVKASGTVRTEDFRGLKKLQEIAGDSFSCGIVLYDGEVSLPFGPKMFALPIHHLWTT